MARGHVADLVPEDAGHRCFAVHIGENAAREIDVATRKRERVDDRRIDDAKLPRQMGALGSLRHALAELFHISAELRILIEPHARFDVGRALPAHRDLFGFPDENELTFSSDGVFDAGDEHPERQHGYVSDSPHSSSA